MSASVIPFDPSRFTLSDERVMRQVVPRLERLGFGVTRETGDGFDSFALYSLFSCCAPCDDTMVPAWVIARTRNGRYSLQDGFGGVLYQGGRLEQVLLPGWLPERRGESKRSGQRRRACVNAEMS